VVLVERKLVLLPVVFVQPTEGSHPQDAASILIDEPHGVVAQAVGNGKMMLMMDEAAPFEIESVEAVFCPDPQAACPVGEDCQDGATG
jgi:hypothetical protein